ncbi:MAG: hypothetical protein A2161_17200 [Candidatus Schekmanbacteria bacterium RBG_13_48_7]|uniref:DUF433 domain-containing protein n=1 Tax=Candidatus Schekmanbacteria bacterium RBG_13_48_7 TaxID=1817878 RepID=A0A1F7S0Y5_9BACT|nr:MAG: hypothetical protein A2161_17200 [Candidatus Schekmanbacteria bacterium RBG_13_48_7]
MEIHHYRFNRITLDPDKCFGKPCIRGFRIPVTSILSYLSSGMKVEEILTEWPELEEEDIHQALGYAAWAMEERRLPVAETVVE